MAELTEEHARLLIYSWATAANYHRGEPTVPNRVTTSRRGPLSLNAPHVSHSRIPSVKPHTLPPLTSRREKSRQSSSRLSSRMTAPPSRVTAPPSRYMSSRAMARHKLLSGLPPAMDRPLDLLQRHIEQGDVTCSEISSTMEAWPPLVDAAMKAKKKAAMVDSVFSNPGIKLPKRRETIHLPSLMSPNSQHDDSHAPISISITYTKTTPADDTPTSPTKTTPTTDMPLNPLKAAPSQPPPPLQVNTLDSNLKQHKVGISSGEDKSSRPPVGVAYCHGSVLAPAAVQAVNTHKLRPIRSTTYLQGQSILTKHSAKS